VKRENKISSDLRGGKKREKKKMKKDNSEIPSRKKLYC